MPTGRKILMKGKGKHGVPTPKEIYKERKAKPEPDNFMPRPKGMASKRLKGVKL